MPEKDKEQTQPTSTISSLIANDDVTAQIVSRMPDTDGKKEPDKKITLRELLGKGKKLPPANLNAFAAIEEKLDINIATGGLAKFIEQPKMRDIRFIYWAILNQKDLEHPTISEEEVGRLVTLENFGEVTRLLAEAIGLKIQSTPEGQSDQEKKV